MGERVAGKYELKRLLGAGSMGAVYEGVHVDLGKRLADQADSPRVRRVARGRRAVPPRGPRRRAPSRATTSCRSSTSGGTSASASTWSSSTWRGEDLETRLARERWIGSERRRDHRPAGRARPGQGARGGHHPPRPQAREHLPHASATTGRSSRRSSTSASRSSSRSAARGERSPSRRSPPTGRPSARRSTCRPSSARGRSRSTRGRTCGPLRGPLRDDRRRAGHLRHGRAHRHDAADRARTSPASRPRCRGPSRRWSMRASRATDKARIPDATTLAERLLDACPEAGARAVLGGDKTDPAAARAT